MVDELSSQNTVSFVQEDTFPCGESQHGDDLEYSISHYNTAKDKESVYPDNTRSNMQIAIEVEDLMDRINRLEQENSDKIIKTFQDEDNPYTQPQQA